MSLSVQDILSIVSLCGEREAWSAVGFAVAALFAALGLGWLFRYAGLKALGQLKRLGAFRAMFVIAMIVPVFIYGSTKRTVITALDAAECPDSVTFTWAEATNATVSAVRVERRLKGATEDEAWEPWGSPVGGGVKHLTVEGFTLDRDYEYRLKYIYEEDD